MTVITGSAFSSDALGVSGGSAILYQRNAYNLLNSTSSDAIDIGTLTTNSTQLDVTGKVAGQNQTDYYKFTLKGNSLKLAFNNLTDTSSAVDLRIQITNSSGTVVADNEGTSAQQTAYDEITSSTGLSANAGDYTVQVNYAPTSPKSNPQSYSISLYSGTRYDSSYETTAAPQTSTDQIVPTDDTMTYATSDAQLYTTTAYHKINETATSTGVNIGWLYQNKSALSVESQLTGADSTDYYKFTLQTDSPLKFAVNQTAGRTGVRVQIMDMTGTAVLADSNGTGAQKKAYETMTSSSGLDMKSGQYVVKVTYDKGADHTKSPTYNFQLYAGDSYTTLDKTTASAETYGHAALAGDLGSGSYNALQATATYLYNQSQGNTTDIISAISSAYSSTIT